MTDKPIIFSAPMIRALLDGRKTQTRRVIKMAGRKPEFGGPSGCEGDPTCWGWEDHDHGDWITLEKEPGQRMGWRDWRGAYAPGDRLWVREAWRTWASVNHLAPRDLSRVETIQYEATGETDNRMTMSLPGRYRHARFMPRWASRLTLTVTDVRVQRVQDISEADAMAEGAKPDRRGGGMAGMYAPMGLDPFAYARGFRDLWDSIRGPGAWDRNDWVAAISFTVAKVNIDG